MKRKSTSRNPISYITADRYHDISAGHRVAGHENKCAMMHGHNYRITFTVAGKQDVIGRVLDFGVIKSKLCQWLEDNWDHKFLVWEKDFQFKNAVGLGKTNQWKAEDLGVVTVPFNPTAENMASFLLKTVGPAQLKGTGVTLVGVRVEETRKCAGNAFLSPF
jgi:6-pyruvoyltetrahydropterin/6-carboxytetrahydropterin synthase